MRLALCDVTAQIKFSPRTPILYFDTLSPCTFPQPAHRLVDFSAFLFQDLVSTKCVHEVSAMSYCGMNLFLLILVFFALNEKFEITQEFIADVLNFRMLVFLEFSLGSIERAFYFVCVRCAMCDEYSDYYNWVMKGLE